MSSEIGTYYIIYDFGGVLLIKLGYSKLIFDVAMSTRDYLALKTTKKKLCRWSFAM